MSVTMRAFSPTNVFLPVATGQVVGFIREPGRFKLLDYVQVIKSTADDGTGKPICNYAELEYDEPVRVGPVSGPTVTNPDIQGTNGPGVDAQFRWAPDQPRPKGQANQQFRWKTVEMIRRNFGYEYGEQTKSSADLPVAQIYRQNAVSKAMTVKTDRVMRLLQTSANWPAANVADANALNGGKGRWGLASSDEQSPNFCAIRLAVQQGAVNVVQLTNASVRPEDLRVLISPNVALKLGSTGEIYNFVKSSRFAEARQEGRNQLNEQYGMPQFYAGVEWIVEDAVEVNEYPNDSATYATANRNWCKNDTTAIMLSRKGGLNGVYGAPSFSTVQLYYYKYEMAVEEYHDTWNKIYHGAIVEQYAEVLAAGRAGMLITNIL